MGGELSVSLKKQNYKQIHQFDMFISYPRPIISSLLLAMLIQYRGTIYMNTKCWATWEYLIIIAPPESATGVTNLQT